MLQSYIPFLPMGAEPINDHVAVIRHDGKFEFYTASGPIYSCRESDSLGLRLAQGLIVTQTTTTTAEIAPWPEDCFVEVKSQVRDKVVTYLLGERSLKINKDFWMREVRRLCADGHQTR